MSVIISKPLNRSERRKALILATKEERRLLRLKEHDNKALYGYDMNPRHAGLRQALMRDHETKEELEFRAVQRDCTDTWLGMYWGKIARPVDKNGFRLSQADIQAPHRNFVTGEDQCSVSLLPVVSETDATGIEGPALWTYRFESPDLALAFINKSEAFKMHMKRQIMQVKPKNKPF